MRLHSVPILVIINGALLNFFPTLSRMMDIFEHVVSRGEIEKAAPANSMLTKRCISLGNATDHRREVGSERRPV